MDALRDHCKALKSVTLNNPLEDPRVSEQDYAKFLMSYGAKLESAHVQTLGTESYEAISEACPNLKCIASVYDIWERQIDAFGTHLHTVVALIDAPRVEAEKQRDLEAWKVMQESFRKCSQLVEIILMSDAVEERHVYDEWVDVMFANPLKKLQKLHMRGPRCMSETKLHMIGEATGALESLHVVLDSVSEVSVTFKPLIDANSKLKDVKVFVRQGYLLLETAFYLAEKVGQLFESCKSLNSLYLRFGTVEKDGIFRINVVRTALPQIVFRNANFRGYATQAVEPGVDVIQ